MTILSLADKTIDTEEYLAEVAGAAPEPVGKKEKILKRNTLTPEPSLIKNLV